MHPRFHPDHGSVVTYVESTGQAATVFQYAMAVGPEIDDPQTDSTWIPVLRTDRVLALVDPVSVVDVVPARPEPVSDVNAPEAVEATRRALIAAMGELSRADVPRSLAHAQDVLGAFARAIDPVERTLDVLAALDPSGALATAVTYLLTAAAMLDAGDLEAGRAAIEASTIVLDEFTGGEDAAHEQT